MNTEKIIRQAKVWTREKTLEEAHYLLGKLHVLRNWSDATDSADLYNKSTFLEELLFDIIAKPEECWQVLLMVDDYINDMYDTLLDR